MFRSRLRVLVDIQTIPPLWCAKPSWRIQLYPAAKGSKGSKQHFTRTTNSTAQSLNRKQQTASETPAKFLLFKPLAIPLACESALIRISSKISKSHLAAFSATHSARLKSLFLLQCRFVHAPEPCCSKVSCGAGDREIWTMKLEAM